MTEVLCCSFKGGFPLVGMWSRKPCNRSKVVARTSPETTRPNACASVLGNHCRIKAIDWLCSCWSQKKLLPKSVARLPKTGESSSLKQATHAQTTGRAIARPNLHKWKPALTIRCSMTTQFVFNLREPKILGALTAMNWFSLSQLFYEML